jgi:murein L,D-transpeptidase YcbB/YkuD
VTAIDITHDPSHNLYGKVLANQLIRDSRTKYVIFDGLIWKARTGKWEKYTGPNKHTKHVHLSVQSHNYDNDMAWILDSEAPTKPLRPTLKRGDRGEWVTTLQAALGIEADGVFGPNTERRVREFQEEHGLKVDGIAGKQVWEALK